VRRAGVRRGLQRKPRLWHYLTATPAYERQVRPPRRHIQGIPREFTVHLGAGARPGQRVSVHDRAAFRLIGCELPPRATRQRPPRAIAVSLLGLTIGTCRMLFSGHLMMSLKLYGCCMSCSHSLFHPPARLSPASALALRLSAALLAERCSSVHESTNSQRSNM
jgi:hypothetical protein